MNKLNVQVILTSSINLHECGFWTLYCKARRGKQPYLIFLLFGNPDLSTLQCVIINKSDDKKTVRSRLEDSAVDY
jgi:hypothetical protein